MFLAIVFFSMLAVPFVWRFGVRTRDSIEHMLGDYAKRRGYRVDRETTEIEAVVDDVAVRIAGFSISSHGGPTTTWTVQATAIAKVQGWVRARPKHEDGPSGLRMGHLEFDTCFFVDGSSRADATKVLGPEVRKLLLGFGPRGQTDYEDGAFTFTWDHAQAIDADLDGAIALAVAACRLPAREGLYRD